MKLIITRHGETIENCNGVCQGQTDGKLSQKGILQAKKLALRFKDTNLDAIYSSDLKRAIDTATEILKFHPNLKLNLDKRIRERFLGEAQGKPFPNDWDWDKLPKEAETDEEICKRAKDFLDNLYSINKDKAVLIVCHGGMKMALLTVIHQKPTSEFASFNGIKNTSVSEFEIEEDGNHKIIFLNCLNHLEHSE
jgi:broad specificity phosphatase PhoE